MLEAILNASPEAQKAPGSDSLPTGNAPLVSVATSHPAPTPAASIEATPDAVEGSAGAVSFAAPMPVENPQNSMNPQSSSVPPASTNPSPTSENPLASIPGIMLEGNETGNGPSVPTPPKPPKKKEPMRPIDFLKIVGALFVVSLIFFGSFFAYIVFNPEEARLFVQFGINRADIQNLLALLVNSTF